MPNIDIYGRIVYEDELYHHGISGMKWGKRNGPPYPLKPGDHSAAEKKAMKGSGSSNASSADSTKNRKKKVIKTAAAVAGTALAAYGGYKLYQSGALYKAGSAIKSASEASKQHRAESKTSFIKQLSDKDLNDRITRMKNENTYAELMGRKYVNGYKGSKKLFNDTMNAIGSRVIVPIGVGTTAYVVESQVRSKYGDEVSRKVFKTVNEKKK